MFIDLTYIFLKQASRYAKKKNKLWTDHFTLEIFITRRTIFFRQILMTVHEIITRLPILWKVSGNKKYPYNYSKRNIFLRLYRSYATHFLYQLFKL